MGEKCSVVATGGYSEIITPYCKREIVVDKNLLSQGLRMIYERNLNKALHSL
jgi:type III pantothenate kinase